LSATEDSEQTQKSAAALAPFHLRWSWWWLFPTILAAWLVYPSLWGALGIGKNKEAAVPLLQRSQTDAQAGRFRECVSSAQRAARLDPRMAEAYINIGWCSAKLGRWDEGITNTREALRLNPNMEIAKNNLDWIVAQKVEADHHPGSTPADAALLLSLQHALSHRYQECVDASRQAIQLNPAMAEAYNNLGYCYASLGNLDDGIGNLREALRLRPDFPLASSNLSWVLAKKAAVRGAHP
jgi:Flp pilus assembly protein TadD